MNVFVCVINTKIFSICIHMESAVWKLFVLTPIYQTKSICDSAVGANVQCTHRDSNDSNAMAAPKFRCWTHKNGISNDSLRLIIFTLTQSHWSFFLEQLELDIFLLLEILSHGVNESQINSNIKGKGIIQRRTNSIKMVKILGILKPLKFPIEMDKIKEKNRIKKLLESTQSIIIQFNYSM